MSAIVDHDAQLSAESLAPRVPPGAGELPAEVFRMIVDGAATPFAVISTDGTIRYAGTSMADLQGWRPDELVGHNVAEFLPPGQLELSAEAITEIVTRDQAGSGVPVVFATYRPDGSTMWVEVGALPLLEVPGVEGIVLRHRSWESEHYFDEFVSALLGGADLPEVLTPLARSLASSVDATGAVCHYGFDGERFTGVAGHGLPDSCLKDDPGGDEPWHRAVRTGELVVCAATDHRSELSELLAETGITTCWSLPVPGTDGLPPSAVTFARVPPGPPLVAHRRRFDRAVRFVQLALQRHAEHQRLLHLVRHDPLTGVANRAQFRDRLVEALTVGERDLAVAFCDLDGFKQVNDRYGHRVGDDVLVEVADRLRAVLRAGDVLARMGGDEFTVLLRNIANAEAATSIGQRLVATLDEPIVVAGASVQLGLSVGLTLVAPADSADDVLEGADRALYRVKRSGGARASLGL